MRSLDPRGTGVVETKALQVAAGTARHGTAQLAYDAPSSRRTQSKQTSEQTNKRANKPAWRATAARPAP
jgi:hypothetical protein